MTVLQTLIEIIRQARLGAYVAVNNALLTVFWEMCNTIRKQEKAESWGTKTVERLASDFKNWVSGYERFVTQKLRYMREFVPAYPKFTILQQAVAKLQRGHNCTLLDTLKQPEENLFYSQKIIQNGWTRAMLVNQIESGLHKRQGMLTSNFTSSLPAYKSELAMQLFKDHYKLDFILLGEEAKESDVENALMN